MPSGGFEAYQLVCLAASFFLSFFFFIGLFLQLYAPGQDHLLYVKQHQRCGFPLDCWKYNRYIATEFGLFRLYYRRSYPSTLFIYLFIYLFLFIFYIFNTIIIYGIQKQKPKDEIQKSQRHQDKIPLFASYKDLL